MRPFNLEEAKAGKPVCTKDGREARIICFDRKCGEGTTLVVLVKNGPVENVIVYPAYEITKLNEDLTLMMAPVKKEGWIAIMKDTSGCPITSINIYDSRSGVEIGEGVGYIYIKIEWEE